MTSKAAVAQEEGKKLAVVVKQCLDRGAELDAALANVRRGLVSHEKQHRHGDSESKRAVLERRLNNAIVKFNELTGSNSVLRDTVDSLRQEKANFTAIEKRLLRDIEKEKRKTSELVDRINSNYCAKDKAIADLQHLRQIADREHFEFEQEWTELNKLIEKDAKLQRFIEHKSMSVPKEKEVENVPVPNVVLPSRIDPPKKEETSSRHLEELKRYEEMFERIKESVGLTSITELLEFFTQKELLNYSLFSHTNLAASSIEQKSQAIKSLSESIDSHLAMETADRLHVVEIGGQDPSLETLKTAQGKLVRKMKHFQKICNSIKSVFVLLQGGSDDAQSTLLDSLEVSDDTVEAFLAEIESIVDGLLVRFSAGSICTPGVTVKQGTRRKSHLVTFMNLPSSIAADPADIDTLSRAFTRAEIESRIGKASNAFVAERAVSAASTRPSTSKSGKSRHMHHHN